MEVKLYIDSISKPGCVGAPRKWANKKLGYFQYMQDDISYRFIEYATRKRYKYNMANRLKMAPRVAFGIIAWWLRCRRQFTISALFENYYQLRLQQYREQREKQPNSWNADTDVEFLNGYHLIQENDMIKRSEAIYSYLPQEEQNSVRRIVNNYLQFIMEKSKSKVPNMRKLSRNEILALEYLSDGEQHDELPSILTEAQYNVAIQSLEAKDMVQAMYQTGGTVCSCEIKMAGQAALDDMKSNKRRILHQLLNEKGLTEDQYELLVYADKKGKCENIFSISWEEYKDQIWQVLYKNQYIQSVWDEENNQTLVLTRKGKALVDEINDLLSEKLASDNDEENLIANHASAPDVPNQNAQIKDSGFRIADERISDMIKVIWSMHDLGMFVDVNGKQPTVKKVMDTFAEILQSEQLKQYSCYMNKALQTTKNTYLGVFYQMQESAETHYDGKENRKLDK